MTEDNGHAMESPLASPLAETMEAPSPYALTPQNAYLLGVLQGLLTEALEARTLSVSPVTDHKGNYVSLLRFTFQEDDSPTYSWVLKLVTE